MLFAAFCRSPIAENDAIDVFFTLRKNACDPRSATSSVDDFVTDRDIAHNPPPSRRQDRRIYRLILSKPHVVGQEGAQVVATQGRQPGYAALLVAAEGAF